MALTEKLIPIIFLLDKTRSLASYFTASFVLFLFVPRYSFEI